MRTDVLPFCTCHGPCPSFASKCSLLTSKAPTASQVQALVSAYRPISGPYVESECSRHSLPFLPIQQSPSWWSPEINEVLMQASVFISLEETLGGIRPKAGDTRENNFGLKEVIESRSCLICAWQLPL